jgi:mono/diheme cytochrome c family protein
MDLKGELRMARVGFRFGGKLALGALGLAALALPMAGALATAGDAPAPLTEEQVAKGRQLFNDNGCNACHALADANAAGSVGPAFDGNPNLDKGHVVNVVANGQGPMPSFSWLGEEDIDLIASYIVQVKK